MRWVVLGAVLAAACGQPPHTTGPPGTVSAPTVEKTAKTPHPEVLRIVDTTFELVARVPAYDAEAAESRVFSLDPEVRKLRGFDLATGKELWSTPLGVEPSGRVKIYPSFGAKKRVLVHVENQLLLFDPLTGALASRTPGPWSQDKTRFEDDRGACSFSTACDLHLVDCDDAHPYGPVLRIAVTHLYKSLKEPHDNVCWGPRHLLGRGGNIVVAVTDGRMFEQDNAPKQEGPITLGIDSKSGKVVWSTRSLGCEHCVTSGISADGSTCWLADVNGKLDVFACATGKLFFQKKLPEKALATTKPAFFTAAVAGRLLLSTATEAALLDASNGKSIWSTSLPPNALGLPLATPLELDRYSTWDARTVLLLDPKTGKEAARFELPRYTELLQSADLGLRVKGGPAFDAKGQKRVFEEDKPLFSLLRDRTPRLLGAGDTAKPLAEVTTDLAIVSARRTAQADEVALFVWGPKNGPGELVFGRLKRP